LRITTIISNMILKNKTKLEVKN